MLHTNKMIGTFETKPQTQVIFAKIDSYIASLGGADTEIKSQISYRRQRKFLWMWSYEKTKDGTLFLAFLLDREMNADFIHASNQISKNRWNHSVVLKSVEDAENKGLKQVILDAYTFAGAE